MTERSNHLYNGDFLFKKPAPPLWDGLFGQYVW